MTNPILEAGCLGEGLHFTADNDVKPRPAASTGEVVAGAMSFFWGSRDLNHRFPPGSLEANPDADEGSEELDLYEALSSIIDQRTFFHGLNVSECALADFTSAEGVMPMDYWLRLDEQRGAAALSFAAAWERLRPLMQHRLGILEGLWRGLKPAPILETTTLTLLLCDGWSAGQVAGGTAAEVVDHKHYVTFRGRRVMPYTADLLRKCKQKTLDFAVDEDGVLGCAKVAWDAACKSAFAQLRLAPSWESRVLPVFRSTED